MNGSALVQVKEEAEKLGAHGVLHRVLKSSQDDDTLKDLSKRIEDARNDFGVRCAVRSNRIWNLTERSNDRLRATLLSRRS